MTAGLGRQSPDWDDDDEAIALARRLRARRSR
jgi:hypothetical protein